MLRFLFTSFNDKSVLAFFRIEFDPLLLSFQRDVVVEVGTGLDLAKGGNLKH